MILRLFLTSTSERFRYGTPPARGGGEDLHTSDATVHTLVTSIMSTLLGQYLERTMNTGHCGCSLIRIWYLQI